MSGAAPFELDGPPALSRSTADRQETLRVDPERLRARWTSAKVVPVDERGRVPVSEGTLRAAYPGTPGEPGTHGEFGAQIPLVTRAAGEVADEPSEDAIFLGQWQGTDYWALPADPGPDAATVRLDSGWGLALDAPAAEGHVWVDLRGHGAVLDDTAAGLLTTAVSLRNWHRRGRYCARCGGETRLTQFGWASTCSRCGREEYPRTDPAVICLVHDDIGVNGERVLLARQPGWSPCRYSVLAGFVEAGESLERCVEREIAEEVGVCVRDIRYLGSQPWPFPRSIMLGFAARADANAVPTPAEGEIEQARWVTREQVRAAFAGEDPELLLPGGPSIAHVMLRAWARAEA